MGFNSAFKGLNKLDGRLDNPVFPKIRERRDISNVMWCYNQDDRGKKKVRLA